ncbi:MAG: Stp1/IreP family PP2C-type Ser/Thr phosphatase [Peptostreptococcaceae bacterium]|nr:Stp1/IreP family PP2C-type Ser/Thr phosphatase [Peptostreptococcaceae bacterium]
MKTGFLTDKGRRRKNNEDYVKIVDEIGLYLLADGVGGSRSGEVASKETVESFANYLRLRIGDVKEEFDVISLLEEAMDFVNMKIHILSNGNKEHEGMATTFVYAIIKDGNAYIGNVGDSRAYLIHNEEIIQITDDHTYVNELVKAGLLTKEEARKHTKKNIITRAIGADEVLKADLFTLPIEVGDKIVLCSDGLYDELTDEDILKITNKHEDMQICAKELIEVANNCGGNDNISTICIKIMEEEHEQ